MNLLGQLLRYHKALNKLAVEVENYVASLRRVQDIFDVKDDIIAAEDLLRKLR
tara:strand:+ start:111 stop:269 length:159 start_codon:yes stop_codon:yes gene_type:complete